MAIFLLRVDQAEPRLDRYVVRQLPDLSRSAVQHLIRSGRITVDGSGAKPSLQLHPGSRVRVELAPEETPGPAAQPIRVTVLFEDEHLLIVLKPPGMVVHPSPGHPDGTLVNALLGRRPELVSADVDSERPGIVHRLDRDTSGLLVVAATRAAQVDLQAQFRAREVDKRYLAILHGRVEPETAAIDSPIGRDQRDRTRMAVGAPGGRRARTEYLVREYLPQSSYVEAKLLTGRTHQLRVHFGAIGHHVVGDAVYGPRRQSIKAPRQMLHSWKLAIRHPATGESMAFTAEPPEDMQAVLRELRMGA